MQDDELTKTTWSTLLTTSDNEGDEEEGEKACQEMARKEEKRQTK
jgi:hypothetical protein